MGKSIIKQDSLLGSLPSGWVLWFSWGQNYVCAGKRHLALSTVRMALAVGLFYLSVIWVELVKGSQSHEDLGNGK